MRKTLPLLLVPLALAACGTSREQHPPPTPFSQSLTSEYRQLAQSEKLQDDWGDSGLFSKKADLAAQGTIPVPEDPVDRGVGKRGQINPDVDYGKSQRAEAIEARQRLIGMLHSGAPEQHPQAAARAQVAYDCWVEQLDEGWQKADIDRCRQAFYSAMDASTKTPVAANAPVDAPAAVDRYQVYFPFDSAKLTDQARRVIDAAAADMKREGRREVTVSGFADRAGAANYNEKLSAERAQAVKRELMDQGVAEDSIRTMARGEAAPVVQTADNVRQPQNRRAVINFD